MLEYGSKVGRYEIRDLLGAGGMGEVYAAWDDQLEREVALKVLPDTFVSDDGWISRFRREAKVIASLDHPGIVTVHSLEEADGKLFLTMQLVSGRVLSELIPAGGLSEERAMRVATRLVEAMAAAHEGGILHRDLKPSNVMVDDHDRVRVLDFGLAKSMDPEATELTRTEVGSTLGTLAYMAPELIDGGPATPASDVFSLGTILYALFTGAHPFKRHTAAATAAAVTSQNPPPLGSGEAELDRIVASCLSKDPAGRPKDASVLLAALEQLERPPTVSGRSSWPMVAAVGVAAVALLLAVGSWWLGRDERWLFSEALPEIERLNEADRIFDAYMLVREAMERVQEHPEVDRWVSQLAPTVSIETTPAGASVLVRDYEDPEDSWISLGTAPLEVPLPWSIVALRLELEGHVPFEGYRTPLFDAALDIDLPPADSARPGMVRIAGGPWSYGRREVLEPYWLDRYEVTNADFQAFVDAGGYSGGPLWEGLGAAGLLQEFADATGRRGPAGWDIGSFPEGEGDLPVTGVSWYEAAAYCRFVGKELPTAFHWERAARGGLALHILGMSNYGPGLAPPGTFAGLGPWGTYDQAGNVKEWVWNAWDDGRRIIRGGAHDEPQYHFQDSEGADPLTREPNLGFRCAIYPPSARVGEPIARWLNLDYADAEPVDAATFEVLAGLFEYDRTTELNAQVVDIDSAVSTWTRERITFDAAYGGEQIILNLFLPTAVAPPYQAVVWLPGADAWVLDSSEDVRTELDFVDTFVRGGRAFAFPVVQSTYERRFPRRPTDGRPNEWRDVWIQITKDVRRTVDYLATREDIDASRVALAGLSSGVMGAPLSLALDPRLRAGVFVSGSFPPGRRWLPEIDPVNFAPRVTQPVLMVNGEFDGTLDYEMHQRPLFEALGTADSLKRHFTYPGGHLVPKSIMTSEVLAFLDEHLGPVQRRRGGD